LEIEMNVDAQTQAVLLLTAWFTKPAKEDPKPLAPAEWGRFALWLRENGMAPELLLASNDPMQCLNGWSDRTVTPERIAWLLERSAALGLALEKWQRAGLWVMTRSDTDYPARLKKRLKFDAPPVLFGCGNRKLLDRGGIAVIGSREAGLADLGFASRLGGEVALQGHSIVSGGARGVDETAMLGALEKEGTVIGILADNLLRAATSAKYRKGLMAKNLVLISPFNPEAGFDVGNAMARNKYVYCLADAAVVVAAGKDKGGTWAGAMENLRRGWIPLWVKPHPEPASGNAALVEHGGRWLSEETMEVGALATPDGTFKPQTIADQGSASEIALEAAHAAVPSGIDPAPDLHAPASAGDRNNESVQESWSFYDFFLRKLASETQVSPLTSEDLQERLDVNKTQLNDWLKRGLAEGKVEKLGKPVRYRRVTVAQISLDL
jgi:predicted Rossmann fold nucleotide-binding protein DprA/Smf involved in DNA uptake